MGTAVKEACAELPNDYATFKKDQPKYLELISQSRSETAFASFLAANAANAKVDALSKVINASVITKHQNDFIAEFKSNSDGSVRSAILAKLNDGSFDKLPYDPTLLSYWSKLSNSRLLAMVYRDGYAKLSEADRKNLVAKISDDAVLTEMVTAPSQDAQREAQNKREKQQYASSAQVSRVSATARRKSKRQRGCPFDAISMSSEIPCLGTVALASMAICLYDSLKKRPTPDQGESSG